MTVNERKTVGQDESPLLDTGSSAPTQRGARLVLAVVLLAAVAWIARNYLISLAWAILIATATWPLYVRFTVRASNRAPASIPPLAFTLLASLVLVGPLVLIAIGIGREARAALDWVADAQETGVDPPEWLANIPVLGERAEAWWRVHLSDPDQAKELLSHADAGALAAFSKDAGVQIGDHLIHVLITFIMLFILYRDGPWFAGRVLALADWLLGDPGRSLANYLVTAARGVVNGLVVNALCVGSIITVAYVVTGVPYPLLFGALTVLLAMIPLGAWLAFGAASLALLVQGGSAWNAAGLFGFSAIAMIVSDNFTQPALVGGAAKLPFLAVLVGILGGLETFGIIGLFLGPISMVALIFVWREWIDDARDQQPAR
jgi:predicted PurR-regulated permease PerM